jgi:hypothetical protein
MEDRECIIATDVSPPVAIRHPPSSIRASMPESARNAELLRSLGRLVRGLSTLFWGLPIALVVCVHTARPYLIRPLGVIPPLLATAWLLYGLWQMQHFQKQERVWRHALDRAKLLGLVNVGLSPFLYWWNRMPNEPFFTGAVVVLAVSALLFLINLNLVLHRLTAMLPDETLRAETRQFTLLNRVLLAWTLVLAVAYYALTWFSSLPPAVAGALDWLEKQSLWLLIFLVLLPLAMTMALTWKTKEVILESVFGAEK